jgi:S1-C subfamily serine protease
LIVALAALVVLGGWEVRRNSAMAAERALLLARTDSLIGRIETTTTSVQGLKTELSAARGETEELRTAIADKEMTLKRLDSLSRRLAASLARHQAVLRAARFDVQAVARDNSDAVGVVLSEFADGRKVAGTGFAIRVRGDTGWVLTCRHLIADSAGRSPARLGVIFNGSNQNFRAELLVASDSADLAILRVQVRAGIPFVRGLASSGRPGDPVAVFGFPFGFDSPPGPDWQRFGVSATSTPGTIRSATPTLLEVDGYGASGSSGSPIFDSAGEVVGVVFGGERGTAGRTLYAVPARQVAELLRRAEAEKR